MIYINFKNFKSLKKSLNFLLIFNQILKKNLNWFVILLIFFYITSNNPLLEMNLSRQLQNT